MKKLLMSLMFILLVTTPVQAKDKCWKNYISGHLQDAKWCYLEQGKKIKPEKTKN